MTQSILIAVPLIFLFVALSERYLSASGNFSIFRAKSTEKHYDRLRIVSSVVATNFIFSGFFLVIISLSQRLNWIISIFPILNILIYIFYLKLFSKINIEHQSDIPTIGSKIIDGSRAPRYFLRISFLLLMIGAIASLSGEIVFVSKLVSAQFETPSTFFLYTTFIVLISMIVVITTGFSGVLVTDIFQSCTVIIIGFFVIVVGLSNGVDLSRIKTPSLTSSDIALLGVLLINTLLAPAITLNPWKIIEFENSAVQPKSLFHSPFFQGMIVFNVFAILLILSSIISVSLGEFAREMFANLGQSSELFSQRFDKIGFLVICVAAVVGLMSTLDSMIVSQFNYVRAAFSATSATPNAWIYSDKGMTALMCGVYLTIMIVSSVAFFSDVNLIKYFTTILVALTILAPLFLRILFHSSNKFPKTLGIKRLTAYLIICVLYITLLILLEYDNYLWATIPCILSCFAILFLPFRNK